FSYVMKQKGLMALAITLTIVGNLIGLLTPKLSGYAVDAIEPGKGAVVMDAVLKNCFLMLGTVVISSILSYMLTLVMIQITKRIVSGMRREMFDRLLNFRVGFFDTHAAGDIVSRITYDIDTINTSLSGDVVALCSSVVTVVGSFVMMVTISPILLVIFLFTIPLTIIMAKMRAGITRPLFRARSGKLGELNGFIEEMISGQKTLSAYHRQISVIDKFQGKNEDAVNAYYKADYMGAFNGPMVNCISNVSIALVTVLGAILYMFNQISLGNISAFMLYSRRFSGPINEGANIMSEIQSAIAAAERGFRMLDEPEEQPLSEHEKTLEDVKGKVRLSHVAFGYTPEKQIIHDLSLLAEPGKVIAIVGPTGAGKTTIINLLMRFYDIDGGNIYVDGTETRKYTRDSVRKAFAMVLQDTWLFHGTVFDNVAYGKEGATMEEVERVCKAAHIHKYIMRLDDQYNTELSDDGSNISKGQKQLLTIARAMLLDAKMLILDEATSNVDTRTEFRLQRAMLHLMEGKTCFIIAHRLSTIRDADLILVVRDGDVVEQGTHESLMAANGFYHELYEAQWSKGEAL
ncbi:MAG: ABC transporter ATP-binding protein, partial [Lachnospiraceae bacterium]|nr:ABC transporter ATP-binding protein [Lachnospiraceae bacterium]